MPIEIVEVDLAEMRRTALLSRAKSPQVRMMYEAMFSLQPGEAKAIIVEPEEDISQLRNLLALCATRANIDLQIVSDRITDRVLFTLKPNQPSSTENLPIRPVTPVRTAEDQAAMIDRRERIRAAALEYGKNHPQISAQEVVDYLRDQGDPLDLPRPTTAVSAVMRKMDEFERIGQSRFSYRG